MTTAYLAQKLMSVKLDRTEFLKLKWLQKLTAQNKRNAIESLKKLLKTEKNNIKTCRLCLREGNENIFSNDQNTAKDIKYALEIQVEEGDGKPQYLCNKCRLSLEQTVQLKMTAEASQWRLQQEAEMVFESETAVGEDCTESHGPTPHGGFFTFKPGRNEIVREWICNKCRKIFHTEAEFADHEKLPNCRITTASDLNHRFVCEFCGKAFRCNMLLNRHRLTHTGEQGEFKCAYCPYRAHSRYKTRTHERSHTGERPYKCSVCTKAFSSPANLWTHKKIHQPPKHHCGFCPKSYTHKMLLNDHIATQHGSETPFNCQTCGKAFATRKRVHKHERSVHNRPVIRKMYSKIQESNAK